MCFCSYIQMDEEEFIITESTVKSCGQPAVTLTFLVSPSEGYLQESLLFKARLCRTSCTSVSTVKEEMFLINIQI